MDIVCILDGSVIAARENRGDHEITYHKLTAYKMLNMYIDTYGLRTPCVTKSHMDDDRI